MSKSSKSRDTSAQTAAEQRKTLSMMMDGLEKMRTPMDDLIGMQQNFSNDQIVKFSDMFSQMVGGFGQQSPQGNPGVGIGQPPQQGANGEAKFGDGWPLGQSMDSSGVFAGGKNQDFIDNLSSKQQPFMQAPQQTHDQMAAHQQQQQQQAAQQQQQQPQLPPWMNMNMGPYGRQ